MSKIHLHIANANQNFTARELSIFKNAAKKAEAFIFAIFQQFDYEVDIIITTPSFILPTIAEDGIAGKTLHSRLIVLSIDKQQRKISEDFVFETICHEMSHSLRPIAICVTTGTRRSAHYVFVIALFEEMEATCHSRFRSYCRHYLHHNG